MPDERCKTRAFLVLERYGMAALLAFMFSMTSVPSCLKKMYLSPMALYYELIMVGIEKKEEGVTWLFCRAKINDVGKRRETNDQRERGYELDTKMRFHIRL